MVPLILFNRLNLDKFAPRVHISDLLFSVFEFNVPEMACFLITHF